ncbi:MAG: hypothetical protein HC883_00735 [Bdellovibrionaceae bacterium]|nr:hypothetical protein [Pseudobdellovibrionaceae bacterium]
MTADKDIAIFIPGRAEKPTSLDPLDADRHENLAVARMVHSTPIEVSVDNTLVSQVLSSFTYDTETRTIRWLVKSGVTYSDGTAITPEDIAFSVARMLHARPNFPVISQIKGTKKWIAQPESLQTFPSGIRVMGNQIEIEFDQPVANPFFRFTLELFSIIPKTLRGSKNKQVELLRVALERELRKGIRGHRLHTVSKSPQPHVRPWHRDTGQNPLQTARRKAQEICLSLP